VPNDESQVYAEESLSGTSDHVAPTVVAPRANDPFVVPEKVTGEWADIEDDEEAAAGGELDDAWAMVFQGVVDAEGEVLDVANQEESLFSALFGLATSDDQAADPLTRP